MPLRTRFPPGGDIRASRTFHLSPQELEIATDVFRLYWTSRKFEFIASEEGWLKARRGSRLGNWTSFDMADLRTQLSLCLSETGDVLCEMMIDGTGQKITTYNRAYWSLELALFEASVRGRGGETEDAWRDFRRQARRDAFRWSFSLYMDAGLSDAMIALFERFGARLEDVQPFRVK